MKDIQVLYVYRPISVAPLWHLGFLSFVCVTFALFVIVFCLSVGRLFGPSVTQVRRSLGPSVGHSVRVGRSLGPSVGHSVLVGRSLGPSVTRSVGQSLGRSVSIFTSSVYSGANG